MVVKVIRVPNLHKGSSMQHKRDVLLPTCGVAVHIVQRNAITHTCEAGAHNDVISFHIILY
jgi:hypothetical protein